MSSNRQIRFGVAALVCSLAVTAIAELPQELANRKIPNWPAAPYWSPSVAAKDRAEEGRLEAQGVAGVPTSPLPFVAITPCRLADTRQGSGFGGQYGPPSLENLDIRTFVVVGQCGVPMAAAAVSLNLAVTSLTANGNLTVYPAGSPVPVVSSLNWTPIETAISNAAVVALGSGGAISILHNGVGSSTVDLIVDVNGYYGGNIVNTITAGSGLTGGGTGDVQLSIAPGGITSSHIAAGAVTGAALAPGVGALPSGAYVLGASGDANLLAAGLVQIGPVGIDVWKATPLSGAPSARSYHTAVWTGVTMIIWGGHDGTSEVNTGAAYDPVTNVWTPMPTAGAPTARQQHTAIWTGSKMIVWGGLGDNGLGDLAALNTGGIYDPTTNSWTPVSTSGAPTGRYGHTAVWTPSNSKMVVWGGVGFLNTGGRYNPSTDAWAATTTTDAPSGRFEHKAVPIGSQMMVWGGADNTTITNTGGLYDSIADTWTATSTTGAPSARTAHTAIVTGSNTVLIWGGSCAGVGGCATNEGGLYVPGLNSWSATTTVGAPAGRKFHTAVWTGSRMIIWGGENAAGVDFANGGVYDAGGNAWSGITEIGATPRAHHTAVWTGSKMIVWGGAGNNTGGYPTSLFLYLKP